MLYNRGGGEIKTEAAHRRPAAAAGRLLFLSYVQAL